MKATKVIVAISITVSFLLGWFTSWMLSSPDDSNVPAGTYSPIAYATGMSFQMNIDSIVALKDKSYLVWIRYDNVTWAKTKTGFMAKTVFTHIQVDCSKLKTATLEERAFSTSMEYIGSHVISAGQQTAMSTPDSLSELTAIVGVCGVNPAQSAPKTDSTTVDKRSQTI